MPVILSGPGAEVKSIKPAEVTLPVLDVHELDTLRSRAPAHLGQTFVKQALFSKSTLPATKEGKVIADLVRGLGIPCEDTDFHCPIQNDYPPSTHTHDTQDTDDSSNAESAIWNPEDDSD